MNLDKLIELVKQNPELYSTSHPEYGKSAVKKKIWLKISKELNDSPAECKAKWSCLRNSMARELRGLESINTSKDKRQKRRKKWYLADAMSFLHDSIRPRYSRSCCDDSVIKKNETPELNENSNDQGVSDAEGSDDEDRKAKNYNFDVCTSSSPLNQTKFEGNNSVVSIEPELRPEIRILPQSYSKLACNSEDEIHTQPATVIPLQVMEESSPNRRKYSTDSDPELHFFKSLLPDVHQLSVKRLRKFKETVLSTLYFYLDEDEGEKQHRLTQHTQQ